MKPLLLSIVFVSLNLIAHPQVSINSDGSAPDNRAMLDVKSGNRGFLPPRMNRIALDAVMGPPDGLIIFCTDCSADSTGALVIRSHGKWFTLVMNCLLPLSPPAGTHSSALSQITWNWQAVADATGYKWNTTDNFSSATDLGLVITMTETSLACNTLYTRYVWAYNDCGHSFSRILNQSTTPCPPDCGGPFNDPRDGKVYATAWIGNQCWMVQNLNAGTRINGNTNPADNGITEKYCYNDLETNCDVYGGLYQWDEMMDYTTSSNSNPSGRQGICPPGWHLPGDAEFCQMEVYLDPTVNCQSLGWRGTDIGGKLKETGYAHWTYPNSGATNSSGFTALPGGNRMTGSGFMNLQSHAFFYTATESSALLAFYRSIYCEGIQVNRNHPVNYYPKTEGFSVRCVKN